jgi:hypothetical protein
MALKSLRVSVATSCSTGATRHGRPLKTAFAMRILSFPADVHA